MIVFRRIASEDPKLRKMVYVSQHISHFGYTADAFMDNKILFRDIVYPADSERTLKEIKSYVERGVENYTQFIQGAQAEDDVTLVVIKTTR